MNLDGLISKYLDGDLTEEEDVELRNGLSSSEDSHLDFDNAVNLHLAMKEDASMIEVPSDIYSSTEDIIMMKILSDRDKILIKNNNKSFISKKISSNIYRFRKAGYFAMAASIVLILNILVISDYIPQNESDLVFKSENKSDNLMSNLDNINYLNNSKNLNNNSNLNLSNNSDKNNYSNNSMPKSQKINRSLKNTEQIASKNKSSSSSDLTAMNNMNNLNMNNLSYFNSNSTSNNKIESVDYSSTNNSAKETNSGNSQNLNINSINNFQTELNSNSDLKDLNTQYIQKYPNIENSPYARTVVAISETNQSEKYLNEFVANHNNHKKSGNDFSEKDFYYNNNREIEVSSFLATDLLVSNLNNKTKLAVSHISQSLAYNLAAKKKIGVEIGYSHFGYNEISVITIHSSSKVTSKNLKIVSNPLSDDEQTSKTIINPSTKSMFWGAAFYEQSLIGSNNLEVYGRLGLGASNDGEVIYGRCYAVYKIIPQLAVTLGSEGKIFRMDLPENTKTPNILSTSCSLVYGLQFNF